jgi:hypothetical protein
MRLLSKTSVVASALLLGGGVGGCSGSNASLGQGASDGGFDATGAGGPGSSGSEGASSGASGGGGNSTGGGASGSSGGANAGGSGSSGGANAGGSGSSGGTTSGSGSGGNGSSGGGRDASTGEGGASSGGAADAGECREATDCKGALPQICAQCGNGTVACAHFECQNGMCVTALCPPPAQDGGAVQCGSSVCATGERCCDHCTNSCASPTSNVVCPDDNGPAIVCANAACMPSGSSCLNAACCSGLHCCVDNQHGSSQATCSSACASASP